MDWQTPIALICVLLAGSFLSRALLRGWSSDSTGCGSRCQKCPAGQPPHEQPLLSLQLPQRDADTRTHRLPQKPVEE